MQMLLKRMKKEEKGFTLIELLAVIVILAVIAIIAIPLIGNIIDNSKTKSDLATARQIYDAARIYATDVNNGTMTDPITLKVLQTNKYLDTGITLPSTKKALDPDNTILTPTATDDTFLVIKDTSGTVVTKKYTKAEVMSQ
ncbi:prepilin-type N-terminal cleavage/methylation domain-containing protein [Paenibacillus sp. SN-8-1]|uniref:prepilin-type N-terminal cleavage/methylation domain-containing protein n=1 Tax=Paenibacillus sp. SN-8-1 TaxID=3435409 RepID=UPI003D9AB2A9